MGKMNKPSNKDRDNAISKLYQAMEVIMKDAQELHRGIGFVINRLDHYIDWRRDGKRYRRSVEKAAAKEKARIEEEAKTKPITTEEGVAE